MPNIDNDKLAKALGITSNTGTKFVPDVPQPVSVEPNATGIPYASAIVDEPQDKPNMLQRYYDVQKRALGVVSPKLAMAQDVLVGGAKKAGESIVEGVKEIPSAIAEKAKYIATGELPKETPKTLTPDEQALISGNTQYGDDQAIDPRLLDTGQVTGTAGVGGVNLTGYDTMAQGYSDLAKQQEKAYTEMAEQRAQIQQAMEQNAKERQARVDEYNAKMNIAIDDYKKMNVSVDNFWADKGTGSKVLAAIGVILGGVGQMKGAQTNTGLDVLMKAIDQDLAIQRANIDKAGRGLEMQKGILSDQLKQFNDIDDAEIASKMIFLQMTEDKLKAASANPNAKIAIGQIQAQKQILGAKLQDSINKSTGNELGLKATFDNLDRIAVIGKKLGISAKIPYTEQQDKKQMVNAAILRAVGQSGVSPRMAEKIARAYYIDTNDLVTGGFEKKIAQLKEELRVTALNKKGANTSAIQTAIEETE